MNMHPKIREAWRRNDLEGVCEQLEKEEIEDAEPLRPLLVWAYGYLKQDIAEDNPDRNDFDYWDDELLVLLNTVRLLPRDDENVTVKRCNHCNGTGFLDTLPNRNYRVHRRECMGCKGAGLSANPKENHKVRLWMNIFRIATDNSWIAFHKLSKMNKDWQFSTGHGACLHGWWGYIDHVPDSYTRDVEGIVCGKACPELPEIKSLSKMREKTL